LYAVATQPGVAAMNIAPGSVNYYRKIVGLVDQAQNHAPYNLATKIVGVGDTGVGNDSLSFYGFYDRTRLRVAANGLAQGLVENFDGRIGKFGLVDPRHHALQANMPATAPNEKVTLSDPAFTGLHEGALANGQYLMNRREQQGNAPNGTGPAVRPATVPIA